MKWKSSLFALAIAVGMTMSVTSCSDSSDDPTPPINVEKDLEDGYLTLMSAVANKSGGGGTRALAGEDMGTSAEQKVNRLRVILYSADTHIAEYAFDYSGTVLHGTGQDFKGTGMLDPNSQDAMDMGYKNAYDAADRIVFVPKAFKVKIQDYKLLVLVNPNSDLVTLTKARKEFTTPTDSVVHGSGMSNLDAFREKVGKTAGAINDLTAFIGAANLTGATTPDNFLMANDREYVDVPRGNIKNDESAAYLAKVSVNLDRAVAKVSLRADYAKINADANAPGAVGTDATWLLDITNKSSYWFRHKAAILGGVTMETASSARNQLYAEDPNFTKYSWERYSFNGLPNPSDLVTTSKADIKNYFNYVTAADLVTYGRVVHPMASDWSTYTSEYALENTMEAAEQYEDVTTAAILKIKYHPKRTAMDNSLPTVSPYFIWKGYVFSALELVSIRDFDPGTATPGDIPKYETFLELQKYLKANSGTLEAATGFGSNYSSPGATNKQVGDIAYNHDNINYYRILIRHFGDDQETTKMAYGRYGIVRNNWYRLTVNSIAGPGSIDIPEPEGPDDKQQFLGVQIEVLPWLVRDQIVDIQ